MCLNRACALLVIGLAVAAGASAQTCFPPPSGLIAWWDGDAVAGGTATDIVGGFDGSLVGDATTAPGIVGDAFSFDGVGDYVQLPIDSGIFTTGQFTIDAWAFPTKLSPAAYLQGIFDNDMTLPFGPRGMTLAVWGGLAPVAGQRVSGVFHNPDGTQYLLGPFPTATNRWHHYALTYDGGWLCLYQDGLQEGCMPASGPVVDNGVNFRIGHGQADTAPQRFFGGKIDEVAIFDRALSANEIQSIFNAGSAGKCKAPQVSCSGFEPPMADYPVAVKGKRALPLKAELFDADGYEVTDLGLIAPPVVQVWFDSGDGSAVDVSDQVLPVGLGDEGNQFVFTDEGKWQFNLKTSNYSSPGTYTVLMESGDDSEYLIEPTCVTEFVIR